MSTRPGSTFDAMALTSLGPEFEDPELPELAEFPELPELPEKPRPPKGNPEPLPEEPDPEWIGRCPEAPDADRLVVPSFQAPWPIPIPAARTTSAAPPTRSPLRTLCDPLGVVGPDTAAGAGQAPVSPEVAPGPG